MTAQVGFPGHGSGQNRFKMINVRAVQVSFTRRWAGSHCIWIYKVINQVLAALTTELRGFRSLVGSMQEQLSYELNVTKACVFAWKNGREAPGFLSASQVAAGAGGVAGWVDLQHERFG